MLLASKHIQSYSITALILLDQAVEESLHALRALLWVSLLVVHIVDKGHAEAGLEALGPLVVVEE
jgi:hypothetical protein